jgi:hypothetical protein
MDNGVGSNMTIDDTFNIIGPQEIDQTLNNLNIIMYGCKIQLLIFSGGIMKQNCGLINLTVQI